MSIDRNSASVLGAKIVPLADAALRDVVAGGVAPINLGGIAATPVSQALAADAAMANNGQPGGLPSFGEAVTGSAAFGAVVNGPLDVASAPSNAPSGFGPTPIDLA
ncbi:hypothetical protein [Segnochrobactrum spirostomi]|uniref:Uncharacterized protein n=1 Tax=Segnochrobactrum spirostomi TaxID=2608987 RepID=A0A6A7Y3B2_9HYPH|nr:hypothetical protein [Segnochrobactrum spirostomi]MQT13604.1 hypothetical protein [Segnochrobactrum spirostomi]